MKIKFMPQNIELEIDSHQTVKEVADKNGIFIKSICNGLPSCAECRVKLVDSDHNVLPPNSKELSLIGTGYYIDQRRLSCQLHCFGDVTVDLTEQIEKQKNMHTRKPQGSKMPDEAPTHAVSGNLIQQENFIFTQEQEKSRDQQPRPQQRHSSASHGRSNQQKPQHNQSQSKHNQQPRKQQNSAQHSKPAQSQNRSQGRPTQKHTYRPQQNDQSRKNNGEN